MTGTLIIKGPSNKLSESPFNTFQVEFCPLAAYCMKAGVSSFKKIVRYWRNSGFVDSGIMGWRLVPRTQGPQQSADKWFSSLKYRTTNFIFINLFHVGTFLGSTPVLT